MTKRYYRPAEAAEYLGVPLNTLSYWRSRGLGPKWTRPERKVVLYDVAELDAWTTGKKPPTCAGAVS